MRALLVATIPFFLLATRVSAQAQTSGACSPSFSQSQVTGSVTLNCGASRTDLEMLAKKINAVSASAKLTRDDVRHLVVSLNQTLQISGAVKTIDARTASTDRNIQRILLILEGLQSRDARGPEVVRQVDAWAAEVDRRRAAIPSKIDPNEFIRRVSGLYLSDEGCPISTSLHAKILPSDDQDLLMKAEAYESTAHYREALALVDRAIAFRPRSIAARTDKAVILCRARRYEEALRELVQVEALAPDSVEILTAQGQLLWRVGKYSEAGNQFAKAQRLAPTKPELPWAVGKALAQTGECRAAVSRFSNALRLDPFYDHAYLDRAECELKIGDAWAAVADYRALIVQSPEDPGPREKLAHAYRVLAADPVKSRQTDYRSYAQEEQSKASELQARSVALARDLFPAHLSCFNSRDGLIRETEPCLQFNYTIYFEREEAYLTDEAIRTLQKLAQDTWKCRRMKLYLQAYADRGEDSFSQGRDLSRDRSATVNVMLFEMFPPGSVGVPASGGQLRYTRASSQGPLLLSTSSGSSGQKDPRVESTGSDRRNQVAEIALVCEATGQTRLDPR